MKTQLNAAFEICTFVVQAITEAGPLGIPSGHLYAALISGPNPVFRSLETYESMIALLIRSGLIRCSNHVLTAV